MPEPVASRGRPPADAAGPPSWIDSPRARQQPPAPDAVPEAIEAGFTRDPDPPYGPRRGRAGFEAGGPADAMRPCSVLAELTGQARGRMGELTDDELIGVLRAARRVQSWQAAIELEAVSELAARRAAEPERPGPRPTERPGPRPTERVSAELAAALMLTSRGADELLSLATTVASIDGIRDALARGEIDLARAKVFADELAAVEWLKAWRIAAKILLAAPGLTTAQLRARLRRAVIAADPDAVRRRQKAATEDARVETWQESSGNAALAGRELPPAAALAANRHVAALARALKAQGAVGTLDHIRVGVYLSLLSGRDPSDLLPARGERLSSPSASTGSWPSGPLGTVHLTMPLSSWLGQTDRPGDVDSYGPADAWTCRDIAKDLADRPNTRYCLSVTTKDGQPAGHACSRTMPPTDPAAARQWLLGLNVRWFGAASGCEHALESSGYRPSGQLAHHVRMRSRTCTAPGCRRPAQACDLDHVVPYDKGGRTCSCNLHPVCRRHHRLKQLSGWHVDVSDTALSDMALSDTALSDTALSDTALSDVGGMTWHLPHGRSYSTRPEPYPV